MKLIIFVLFCFVVFNESKDIPELPANFNLENERFNMRIVGGAPTDILNFPYQVSLQWYYRHLCGGVIISNRWILSAAHCTQIVHVWPPLFAFTVRLGSSFVMSEGVLFGISRIVDHPGYGNTDNRFDYDITLIQVSREIVFSNIMQPATLPPGDADPTPGSPCVVTGWGALTQGGSSPVRLHVVTVPLISNESCNEFYEGGMDYISYSMLCAGSPYGGRDACQGDSGGPLSINGVLMGIVSWGYGCAQPSFPGVYASVPAVRQWITSTTGI